LFAGDLFFAIRGENSDGHDYVANAFGSGAVAAVVAEEKADALKSLGPLYVVHDVLQALDRLAIAARARSKARLVAVTGSVGKTSTKEALRLVLGTAGTVHASIASYNNHWGVPLTLARMPRETNFGVIEIGMNHAGEITPLVAMAKPHVAIITAVAPVHLEFFASIEAIADAKAEIFSGLVPGGIAILNRDNNQYGRLLAAARASNAGHVESFGADPRSDARLVDVKIEGDKTKVKAQIQGQTVSYEIGAPGRHLAVNSLAVLLTAKAFGLDLEKAAQAFAGFDVPEGRGRRFTLTTREGAFTLLDESYNANPASMRAAFALIAELTPPAKSGRRIAVLGDMRELGPRSEDLHSGLAIDLQVNHIDLVFAAGPMMKTLYDALPKKLQGAWRASAEELESPLRETIRAGDLIMVKGSNGSRMHAVVKALKARYPGPRVIS
jgi:UDP-N-acetylmuramoyl-tripeptide--D-alanyl-D-alanine ligase